MTNPKFGAWECWPDPTKPISIFVPVRWVPGEAWALINGAWTRVDGADVGTEARELNEASYNQAFAYILIALRSPPSQTDKNPVSGAAARSLAGRRWRSAGRTGLVVL
jgi:hypothetical protein